MKILLYIPLLLITCFSLQAQTIVKDEYTFKAICEALLSIKEVQDSNNLVWYDGNKTLFIQNDTTYIHDPDRKIEFITDSIQLSLWFMKDLFFNNIPYWIELTKICIYNNDINIDLRSFNSVNYFNKRAIIKGSVVLKRIDGIYVVQKSTIRFIKK